MTATNDNILPRWKAVITYRTANGPCDVEHDFEELQDLHDIVERGPHWDTIIECRVTINRCLESPRLTVERAATL